MKCFITSIGTLAILFSCILHADEPLGDEEWKLEVVHRKKGRAPLRGLVQYQDRNYVFMKRIFRRRGHPTVVMADRIPRSHVEKVEVLPPEERQKLIDRLEKLAQERKVLAAQLKFQREGKVYLPPGEEVPLKPVPWNKEDKENKALEYESTWFRLVSNAREDIVQLTAIRLEQVFTAYRQHLTPRNKPSHPTTIILTRTMEDYRKLVLAQGRKILNPAFFDPTNNQVVCGGNLEQLSEALIKADKVHSEYRNRIEERTKQLEAIYNRRIPTEVKLPILTALKQIQEAETKNHSAFQKAVTRLYQRLYHEAFHAYLNNAVLSQQLPTMPIWLNEGLAQIFETALVEAGQLRVGHADVKRLRRLRESIQKKKILPLEKLLRASAKQFHVAHLGDQTFSDRYYLASWGLAFYLTFELGLLDTVEMETYAQSLKAGSEPVQAFVKFVGKPLADFEKDFHYYLKRVKNDGTLPKKDNQ